MGSTKSLPSLSVLVLPKHLLEQMGSSPVSICDARQLVIGKSNGDLSSRETTEEEDYAVLFSGEEEEMEGEWCGENRFCFYFVKQFAYDDPEIKAKIDEADNEIYNCNSERIHIANSLKAKRAERLSLVASLESLTMDQEVNSLRERLSEVNMEMELLDAQLGRVIDQRDRAFQRIKFLRIQRDKGNAAFFQSRVVMKKAIELAASGNFRDLEELANSEVDKFMSRWNNDKAFREDYKKRILPSVDERIRSSESDVDTENRDETVGNMEIEFERFSKEEEEESDEKEEEETLKEKKREEQLEKAKLAMERKRKLHEKAAARAAARDKKEAEKKLKELEKRAKKKKKKDLERTPETVTEGSEPEKNSKEKPLNGRSASCKQRSLRYRHHKKGNDTVPKAILKRRRAHRLWVWSVFSAALALALALFIVFYYLR